jgi:hypothetical protein
MISHYICNWVNDITWLQTKWNTSRTKHIGTKIFKTSYYTVLRALSIKKIKILTRVVDGWKYSIIIGGCGNFFIYYKIVLRKSVYSAKKVENLVPRTGVLLAPHEVPKRCRNDVVSQHKGRCDPKSPGWPKWWILNLAVVLWLGITWLWCDAHPVWRTSGFVGCCGFFVINLRFSRSLG